MDTEQENIRRKYGINNEMERFMEQQYLSIDTVSNAVDNLEMILHFLENVPSNYKWKWVVIATHQALYSFLICAVKGTAAPLTVNAAGPKAKQAILAHWDGDSFRDIAAALGEKEHKVQKWISEYWLIGIHEALEKAKDPKTYSRSNSKHLKTTQDEDEAIERLIKEFRNGFEHFFPKSWSINICIFPEMIKHVMRVIGFLALESNAITYLTYKNYEARIERALQGISRALEEYEDANC